MEKFAFGFVKFAKKVVASWLSRKVATLKTPLRARMVTGTDKFWQCFATTEVATRVEANNDGINIVRTVSLSDDVEKRKRRGREDLAMHKMGWKEP